MNCATDIIEIIRFRDKPYELNKDFYQKIFTKKEIEYCISYNDPYPHFAVRFAAKECMVKLFDNENIFSMRGFEVLNNDNCAPYVKNKEEVSISLSHTNDLALCFAILS